MRIFIEVTESGEWHDDLQDYMFDDVGEPTFFAVDQIQWFQQSEDSVIIGIIGYDTVFKTDISAFVRADMNDTIAVIRVQEKE